MLLNINYFTLLLFLVYKRTNIFFEKQCPLKDMEPQWGCIRSSDCLNLSCIRLKNLFTISVNCNLNQVNLYHENKSFVLPLEEHQFIFNHSQSLSFSVSTTHKNDYLIVDIIRLIQEQPNSLQNLLRKKNFKESARIKIPVNKDIKTYCNVMKKSVKLKNLAYEVKKNFKSLDITIQNVVESSKKINPTSYEEGTKIQLTNDKPTIKPTKKTKKIEKERIPKNVVIIIGCAIVGALIVLIAISGFIIYLAKNNSYENQNENLGGNSIPTMEYSLGF